MATSTMRNGSAAPRTTPASVTGRGAGAVSSRFRPSGRARARLAVGVLLLVVGMLVSVAVYWRLDRKAAVVQLVRDVPAGQQITADDLGQVRIAVDGRFAAMPVGEASSLIGSWAKTRLTQGSLLTRDALQSAPLVAAGHAVVALRVPVGELPVGLRERSRLQIVLDSAPVAGGATSGVPMVVDAVAVALPSAPEPGGATVSLSIELLIEDAPQVANADRVRLLLIAPGTP